MKLLSLLLSDPVVAASISVIAVTCGILGYLAYFFIKNVVNAKAS